MVSGRSLIGPEMQFSPTTTFGTLFMGANTIDSVFGNAHYIFRVESSARPNNKQPVTSPEPPSCPKDPIAVPNAEDPTPTPKPDRKPPLFFARYERTPWKKVPKVDILFVRQPKDFRLCSVLFAIASSLISECINTSMIPLLPNYF